MGTNLESQILVKNFKLSTSRINNTKKVGQSFTKY